MAKCAGPSQPASHVTLSQTCVCAGRGTFFLYARSFFQNENVKIYNNNTHSHTHTQSKPNDLAFGVDCFFLECECVCVYEGVCDGIFARQTLRFNSIINTDREIDRHGHRHTHRFHIYEMVCTQHTVSIHCLQFIAISKKKK